MEIVDSVVALLGHQAVGEQMKKQREERATERDAKDHAQLEKLVKDAEEGKAGFVLAERATEKSLLVGYETNKAGEKVHPGRFHLRLTGFNDEKVKTALLGAKAGTEIDTPYEGKVVITHVYDEVAAKPEPAPEAPAEAPKKSKKAKA
jgi:hypothetical protein